MMTGGKLMAAVLMMLAMVAGMVTYLDDAGFVAEEWDTPLIAAAVIGWLAGWTQLGKNLGRDFMVSGLFGVGAGIVAVLFFAFVYGLRSAYITHFGVQFDAAIDLVAHIIDQMTQVLTSVYESRRTLAALVAGSMFAGIISEYFNRIWK